MTRDEKLEYHLEMVMWRDLPDGTTLNKIQVAEMLTRATPLHRSRAYQRALTFAPLLLPEERTGEF